MAKPTWNGYHYLRTLSRPLDAFCIRFIYYDRFPLRTFLSLLLVSSLPRAAPPLPLLANRRAFRTFSTPALLSSGGSLFIFFASPSILDNNIKDAFFS